MEGVVEKLDNINKTLEGIRQILGTPENKVMTIFKYVGAGVGALGILGIVELIRQWVMEVDMIFQLIISIVTLILGLVIFFLARKYEKHQPDLKGN